MSRKIEQDRKSSGSTEGGYNASVMLSKFCVELASVVKDFLHGGIHLGD